MANTRDIRLVVRTEVEKALQDFQKLREEQEKTEKSGAGVSKMFGALKTGVVGYVAALGTREVVQFATETASLNEKHKELLRSFSRLATKEGVDAKNIMDGMKRATGGTVDEMELMAKANYGKNMGLQFKSLPTLLEFAAVQAREMGQDVNYMTESIIAGLGRKSPLILDNLGLTMNGLRKYVQQIAEENGTWTGTMNSTIEGLYLEEAAVRLAQDKIKEYGALTDTVNDKKERMAALITDVKTKFGGLTKEFVSPAFDFVNAGLQKMSDGLDTSKEQAIGAKVQFGAFMDRLIDLSEATDDTNDSTEERNALIKTLNKNYGDYLGNINLETATTQELRDALKEVNEQMDLKIAIMASEERRKKFMDEAVDAEIKYQEAVEQRAKLLKQIEEQGNAPKAENVGFGNYAAAGVSLEEQLAALDKNIPKLSERRKKFQDEAGKLNNAITEMQGKLSGGGGTAPGGKPDDPAAKGKASKADKDRENELKKQAEFRAKMAQETERIQRGMISPYLEQQLALDQWYEDQKAAYGESEELLQNYNAKRSVLEDEFIAKQKQGLTDVVEAQAIAFETDPMAEYMDEMAMQVEALYAYFDLFADMIGAPFEDLLVDMTTLSTMGEQAWKNFADSAIGNLKRLIAKLVTTLLLQKALSAFTGTPFNVLGIVKGVLGVPAAADGAYVKKRSGGQLMQVGEGASDEIIVPMDKLDAFLMGKYTLPGGFNINDRTLSSYRPSIYQPGTPTVNVSAPQAAQAAPNITIPVSIASALSGQEFHLRTTTPQAKHLAARRFGAKNRN